MDARRKQGHQLQGGGEPISRLMGMQKGIGLKRHEEAGVRSGEETYFAPAGRAGREDLEKQAREVLANPVIRVFLETVQGYLLVLNEHRQILAASPELLEALNSEDPGWLIGLRPGESLNCAHFTEGPDGCGTSVKCKSCGAILSILACQEKHAPATRECSMSMGRGSATEIRDFQVRCTPLRDGNNRLSIFSIVDISQAKRREALEDVFLHDLLNSLASMEGLSQFQGQIDPQQIIRQYQSLTKYLKEEILCHRSLKEAERGTLEPVDSWIPASEILTELEGILRCNPHAGNRSIHFKSNSDGRHYLDKVLLLRVLLNMALNAMEASSAGAPITITYENDGICGIFSVHNSSSIPDEVATSIFERSFSTKGLPGHGLGTYSIKLLGEKYLGGKVSFITSPATGTVFSIQVPFVRGQVSMPKNAGAETTPRTLTDDTYPFAETVSRPLHILFIDDMEPLARLGKLFLEREGFKVTAKTDAVEALSLFQRNPEAFGLVITDVSMPKLNGLELARRIHAYSPEMPIILCTGHKDAVPITELKAAGIRAVVSKPFISSELGRVVQQIRFIIGT
jgi:CheY-like chemotaxis protein